MGKFILLLLLTLGALTSCTDNDRAKNWGGTEEVKLRENHVLVGVTWKESQMWIHTKDTITGINYFKEKSSWGVLEGTVIFK